MARSRPQSPFGSRILRWEGLLVILGLALTAAAQEATLPPPPTASEEVIQIESNLVNMFFTVRDGKGRLVKNLRPNQLRVTDNGQPQAITHFAEEVDGPLALAVVFDKSASVESHFAFQRQATMDFLRSTLRPDKDRVALITFDKDPRVAAPFTHRVADIEKALAGLKPEGGSALFEAARLAIEEELSDAGPVRKVLILVTDGEDTVSWTTRAEVSTLALSENVIVYTLGVQPDGPGAHRRARRDLQRLGDETGGQAFFPSRDPKELAELFKRLEEELRHQYSLGYLLPPPDGRSFHRVEISTSRKNHRVRGRRGYYTSTESESEVVSR